MSREYLEELSNKIRYKKECIGDDTYRLFIKKNELEFLDETLQRLEAIDNANPSEALKDLKIIGNCWLFGETDVKKAYSEQYETIEQYILKAQEQEKQYLEMQKKVSDYDMINRILKDGIWIECKYPQFKEPCMMKEKVGIYIRGNNIILECYNKTLLLSDYKKTFWFKKDKSE